MPLFRRTSFLALILVALALLGCRVEDAAPATPIASASAAPSGLPRGYLLGFSSIPSELTDEAYLATYDLAAGYGESLLIQRPPAWADFLPGATISDELRAQTLAEKRAAEARGLSLVYVLDPFDPASHSVLQGLPTSHAGQTLGDAELRQALVADALFIARNVRPAYLVIGSEINVVFEQNPEAYAQFVAAYSEAYDAVKETVPETKVLASFQYEELLGVIPWLPPHTARWELLDDFAGRLDQFGITTYPSFAFAVARKVQPFYYAQISERTNLPVAIISAGYASGVGREGINASTPAEQRRFLQRLFSDADNLGATVLIWLIARDLSYAAEPPEDLVATLGLQQMDGTPKEAWPAWLEAVRRPYDPEAAERARFARIDAEAAGTATAGSAATAAAGVGGP
ncbi:MAG: hypothetical protein O3A10_04575 [Chloroflexi bacterium]|nr:hypothetical protein [Chloroflexota bacterium]MDA1146836.1 hypothetical protein [Chloroflexota bacterium]